MKTNVLAAVLGTGFLATGIFAFFLPEPFFDSLGSYYGTFNLHFVKDAGIAFSSSGFLLLLSLRVRAWRTPLSLGGCLFLVLHGLFHVQMLLAGMAPTASDVLAEIVVIISPSALAGVLLWLRLREDVSLGDEV